MNGLPEVNGAYVYQVDEQVLSGEGGMELSGGAGEVCMTGEEGAGPSTATNEEDCDLTNPK